ncbi:MAG TPA: hypothetical protein VGO11_26375 [Chthoniobacteraceae bacterium]|nr:hypothetical protein [Chthoniobacteraceae bacterium]
MTFLRSCHTIRSGFAFTAMLILTFGSALPIHAAPPAVESQAVVLKDADTMEAEFRVGAAGKIGLAFKFADGKTQTLLGAVKADALKRTVEKDGRKVPEMTPMPEGAIEFSGPGLRFQYHSRPFLQRYTEAQQADLAKLWETLPAASQCRVPLEVRTDAAGAELWMDGRYCGRLASESRLAEVSFQLEAGGEVRGGRAFTRVDNGKYLPLDVRRIARPDVMQEATVSLKPGPQQIKAVPMLVADGAGNADVGMAREMQGLRALETNENTSRISLDGMKESLHFSVPQAFYHRAWVLCAVDPDVKRDPVLTTRLTRFGIWGRGGAMADTTLTLPRGDEKPGEGIEPAGRVEFSTAGQMVSAPLWLVRVDLKTGDILDLLADQKDPNAAMKIGPYLDFEFLGQCGGLEVQTDRRRKPVPTSTSAVHVFGVTLEEAPAELRLKQAQPGNIFHNDETPETTFAVRANTAGHYELQWEITEVAGRVLAKNSKGVELPAAGSEADIVVPLTMPDLGWYGLRVTLADSAGHALIQHNAAFALLGKDTRTAGYESPFGTWWFSGVHYTTQDPAVAGPLLFKAGFRRTPMSWNKLTEADFAPWKFTLNQIQWPFRLADLKDWPAAEKRAELAIGGMLKRFPHCQYIDLFHESYDPRVYPPEIYGEKYTAADAAQAVRDDELFELGVKAAKFMRAKFPQLKIIAGNSGGSSGLLAVLLRRGFPRELIDYLGSETTSQTFSPEKISPNATGGIWLMAETARNFGYDIPLAGCFEFTSRAERDLGAQRHAEWYARDVLTGLAFRFPTISPAGIEDVGNAYYDHLWGASGLCERQPLHYPKPAYVALATLTKVLDSVQLVQQMPTGSSSAHAVEFARGQEHIYALWTPRGQCEMEFEFPGETAVTQVEFYGAQRPLQTNSRRFTITADSAVSYVISPVAATRVTAGRRAFPGNQPPAGTSVISKMDDLAQWQLAPADPTLATPLRRPGQFELRQVNDAEKGACLELELKREGEIPAVVGEYTALRLKQPLPIPGRPHTVGVWVKGDSSWGRIYWELEDAKGERWRSSKDYDGGDWANQSALDFDGWCFVTFPLTRESPAIQVEPGAGLGQWQGNVNDQLDYPLKLTGLIVQTHRQSLDLTRMVPVKGTIRLKDVSAIGGTP